LGQPPKQKIETSAFTAAGKLHPAGKKRQGMTLVVPMKLKERMMGFSSSLVRFRRFT
jgi:hypothetical protein